MRHARRLVTGVLTVTLLMAASPSRAQTSTDPNAGAVTLTTGLDFANAYYFRGILQDKSGLVVWPAADLGFAFHAGDGVIRSLGANVGLWNSLHTGDLGLDGPLGKMWYESDFYATLAVGFPATTASLTYTAYTSPNGAFPTVRELSVRVGVDDSGWLGRFAARPYVLVAKELDGQADAGRQEGTYLEIGAAPGVTLGRVSVMVPIKTGLSLRDYYEGFSGDERFGFFSAGGTVSVPLTAAPTRFGTLSVRGGVEFLTLGDRNREIALEDTGIVAFVGAGLSY